MSLSSLQSALDMIAAAGAKASAATDPEAAIHALIRGYYDALGDRDVHTKPGSLLPDERQFFVAGAFFVTPDTKFHMLVGSVNFPPEQERLMVPIDGGHPGWVYQHKTTRLLKNTDDDTGFRQYLKTARMGSAMYAPLFWEGDFIGQIIMAAQARWTMRDDDLRALVAISRIAAAVWIAKGGPAWLKSVYPPKNAFIVGTEGL